MKSNRIIPRFLLSCFPDWNLFLWSSPVRVFAVCLLCLPAFAASVTGTLKNPDGTGFTNVVLFRPKLDRAVLISSTLTPFVDTRVTPSTNGGVAVDLRAGDYLVYAGASRPFSIAVPDSTNSYELTALVVGTNILSAGPFNIVSTTVGDATSTGGGKVKTDATVADPVVYLASTVDDLIAATADAAAADVGALNSELNAALEQAVADLDAVDTGLAEDLAAQAASFAAATALKLDAAGGGATNLTVDGGGLLRIPPFTGHVVSVTSPAAYQVFQRSGNSGSITVTAVVTGATGTTLQARWKGGSWTTIGTSDQYGAVSGTLAGTTGQGLFEARVSGGSSTDVSVTPVSIGDVFAIWGQSNGSGRGTNYQAFTNSTIVASLYGNDGVWKLISDPTDSNTNQLDSVSSDYDSTGMGSVWPLVADEIIATTGVPVAFVQCTKGATGFGGSQPTWTPTASPFDRDTLFGSALYRTLTTGARAVLWWQGEGGFDDTTGAIYTGPFATMMSTAVAQIPGLKILPAKLQECPGVTTPRMTNGWYAIDLIWQNNTNALRGPTLADIPVGSTNNIVAEDEGTGSPFYHLKLNATLAAAAHRWATNIVAHFP